MKRHLKIDTNRQNQIPAPVKNLTDEEILKLYPNATVDRSKVTRRQKIDRMWSNRIASNLAGKLKPYFKR